MTDHVTQAAELVERLRSTWPKSPDFGPITTAQRDTIHDAADLIERLSAELAARSGGWERFDENTPVDTNLLAWGDNWRWRQPHVAYHHSSFNGHKLCVTEDGRCGALFMLGNEGAPTHWMPLPTPPAISSMEASSHD